MKSNRLITIDDDANILVALIQILSGIVLILLDRATAWMF
jgi:hypothetical protein